MKTTAEEFTVYGNTGLLQLKLEPETAFPFKPAGPEMSNGSLIITEAAETGIVSRLMAINNIGSYLLLTDADVLTGAKQNRIVNRSVLLAPGKTILDVSCVERLRWHYTDKHFSGSSTSADARLRQVKAVSLSRSGKKIPEPGMEIQREVWDYVHQNMANENFSDLTENYLNLVQYSLREKATKFPVCKAKKGCRGVAVMVEGKVECMDLFGSEEAYRYYFPLLRNSAFRMAVTGPGSREPDFHESNYRMLEMMDRFEELEITSVDDYKGAGDLEECENKELIGTKLSYKGEMVHIAIFGK